MKNGEVVVIKNEDSVEEISRKQMILMLKAMKDFQDGEIGQKEMDLLIKASGMVARHIGNIINSKKKELSDQQ